MKKMKKILLCSIMLLIAVNIFYTVEIMATENENQNITVENEDNVYSENTNDVFKTDIVKNMYDTNIESPNQISILAASANTYTATSVGMPYLFKNVKHDNYAMQNIYVTSNYVYATQRIDADSDGSRDDTAIGRFTIGDAYCWSTQIGRVKYSAGTTVSNYTKICRLTNLGCANNSGSNSKELVRVAAATSEDGTQLTIRTVLKSNGTTYFQYATYDLEVVDELLDKVENLSGNYVSFKGNKTLSDETVCTSFIQPDDGPKIHPNGSFQGVEIVGSNIYIAGGTPSDDYPLIAKMTRAKGNFVSGIKLSKDNNVYYNTEIEGLCYKNSSLYFAIIKGGAQFLCYANLSDF